jgi:glycosyltransferase involved in cell wall biosynthesis
MYENKPKLSICVITYNHTEFIKSTIESILSQDLPENYELIIADDKSTDDTRAIIDTFAEKNNKIVRIYQETNIGPAMNWKVLIEASKGEYVAYIDGDDLMLPGKIKTQIDFLDSNPQCNFICHNMKVYAHEDNKYLGDFSSMKSGLYDVGDLARFGTFFANSSKMYRRECNLNYPYYDGEFKFVGDYVWHIYHVKNSKFAYLSDKLGVYRKHSKGASSRNNSIVRIKIAHQENVKAIILTNKYNARTSDVNFGLMREYYAFALSSFLLGDFVQFKSSLHKSVNKLSFYSVKHFCLFFLSILPVTLIAKFHFLKKFL